MNLWMRCRRHMAGKFVRTGPYHLELVAKDGELVLYMTDHAE